MIFFPSCFLLSALFAVFGSIKATSTNAPVATLTGHGTFIGTVINQTITKQPLPASVNAWLGIDYASQPIGANRFTHVGPPKNLSGIQAANEYGKICVQDPSSISYAQDEACLNMNVYRTQNISMSQKLPVLVWIHGGGFVSGSARSFDGAAFVASSKAPLVVVTFNYRVSALGFLPSLLFQEKGLLNLGLTDQRRLLEFVQKYITNFGGDPDAVTLGGRSAGAHSTGIHYFHNYGTQQGHSLFARAIMQSGGVTARAFPNASYALYQRQYAQFMNGIGCAEVNDTLDCLRAVNVSIIETVSSKLFTDSEYNITWPFQPTLGGALLEKPGSVSGIEGTFYKLPVITTSTTDEGKYYTPGDLITNDQFLDYMHNISPGLNATDIDLLDELYPDPVAYPETSPYINSPNSTQYNRVSAAWTDYGYVCPGQETAYRTSTANVPTWKLRFNTNNSFPAWQGIPHTSDTKYTWNAPDVQYPNNVSHILHGYFASFVATGNPNTLRWGNSPKWPNYHSGYGLNTTAGQQILISPNETKVEPDIIRREQCLFWRDPLRASRLNK
ncbi:MAG: hypothetical protein M1834_009567 [Cirrosporium novae-zelandiae]|nr:MAG: hypothetical protein M1834_009567 [Cirrosporium novae-zelandiae]